MPSELIFRAQLIIPEQRQLYDYWCRCAGSKLMPTYNEFQTERVAPYLSSLSFLHVGQDLHHTIFARTGSLAHKLYGEDVSGKSLTDLDWGNNEHYWMTVYNKMIEEKKPLQGATKGSVVHQDHFVLFWLRMPMSEDGQSVHKILCHDVIYYTQPLQSQSQNSPRQYETYETEHNVAV